MGAITGDADGFLVGADDDGRGLGNGTGATVVGFAVGAGEYDTWKLNESVMEDSSAQDSVNVYVLASNEPGTT